MLYYINNTQSFLKWEFLSLLSDLKQVTEVILLINRKPLISVGTNYSPSHKLSSVFPLCDFICSQKDDTIARIHQKQEVRETGKNTI